MKKGMLFVFWGLMFLTLTIAKVPWGWMIWLFNMVGYGLCAAGMFLNFRNTEIRSFLISGILLCLAMICSLLTLTAQIPLRYNGILMMICRIFELVAFSKLFEGCWKQFRKEKNREKTRETSARQKVYILFFTFCAMAEALCWFIGAAPLLQIVELMIRFAYGALMACVMMTNPAEGKIE